MGFASIHRIASCVWQGARRLIVFLCLIPTLLLLLLLIFKPAGCWLGVGCHQTLFSFHFAQGFGQCGICDGWPSDANFVDLCLPQRTFEFGRPPYALMFEPDLNLLYKHYGKFVGTMHARPVVVMAPSEPTQEGRVFTLVGFRPWIPPLVFGSLPLLNGILFLFSWHRRRRRYRILHGLCTKCGYDMRATPLQCSECGFVQATTIAPVEG